MNLAHSFAPQILRPFDSTEGASHDPKILPALHCENAFGGGSSKESTSQTNQQVAASEGSLAVGAGSKYQESGSVDLAGASNLQLAPSLKTEGGGNITITTADANILSQALDSISQLSAGYGSSLNQFITANEQQKQSDVTQALDAISAGKESADTAAQNRKIFLYLAGGLAALIALWIWLRGK